MSRASWLLVGGVALAVAACAAGAVEDDTSLGDGGTDAGPTTVVDSGTGPDGSPARPVDGSATPPANEDAGAPAQGEDSAAPGEDGGGDDAAGEDASEPDSSEPGTDAGHPDAGHDSGSAPTDAGTDSGSPIPDAGEDAGCSPTTPAFTKVFHDPALAGFCDGTQITDFYNDCFAGTSGECTTWQGANAQCNTCLAGSSSPTSTDWGPIVNYPLSGITELDLGGCLDYDPSATGSNTEITNCSEDLEYLIECEHAACDVSCGTSTSTTAYNACATAADDDPALCQSEYNAVNATGADCSKVTSACFGGTNFQTAFTAVATVMCD